MNSNYKSFESEELNKQNSLHRPERNRERRRTATADTSTGPTNASTNCQNHCYHQLAERVRELEKEITSDVRAYQMSPAYSPCSNFNQSDISNYHRRPQNFPIGLMSPNSSIPTQRHGLSSKVIEHAHQIPERLNTRQSNS